MEDTERFGDQPGRIVPNKAIPLSGRCTRERACTGLLSLGRRGIGIRESMKRKRGRDHVVHGTSEHGRDRVIAAAFCVVGVGGISGGDAW